MRTKSLLTIGLAAAGMMYGSSVFAAGATPTSGPFGSDKITFTGTITNSPCDVAPGDDAITVPFGQISYRKPSVDNVANIELSSGAGRNILDISTDIISDRAKLRCLQHYIKTQYIKLLIIDTYRKGRHQNLPE